MPLQIIHHDITHMACDAIVNPTDSFYSGSGGTDFAIHEAAGKELDEACKKLPPLDYGEVEATEAFRLHSKYIIHTMGPVWRDGRHSEAALLRGCYINALMKAKRLHAKSVAFPLISSGTFGFPKDKVLRIAIDAIGDFLFTVDSEILVYVCVRDRNAFELSKDIALREYMNRSKRFVYEDHALKMERAYGVSSTSVLREKVEAEEKACDAMPPCTSPMPFSTATPKKTAPSQKSEAPVSLADWIGNQDDSFAILLRKLIRMKGLDEVDCYKMANVSKQTFWKIKNDPKYLPNRTTVILFAIALELNLEETEALLKTIGATLSHCSISDLIIEFYISNGCYNTYEIDAALFQYGQKCLWSEE